MHTPFTLALVIILSLCTWCYGAEKSASVLPEKFFVGFCGVVSADCPYDRGDRSLSFKPVVQVQRGGSGTGWHGAPSRSMTPVHEQGG